MKKIICLIIFTTLIHCYLTAQNLPVIRATSKNLKIRDGEQLKENFWVIIPETKPDIYWVDFPKKDHTVTFITDRDSISFDVKYGNHYDFIILLNDKDSCYTRISATYSKSIKPVHSVSIDSIPFTMKDNRIYVKGKINNSSDLNFQFDLGAGGVGMTFINHKSVKKVSLNFDKTTNLGNSDGFNQAPMSSQNTIQIGKSIWQSIEVVETKNMNKYEDALFGNGLFEDKYIEVNYDKMLLIIHDKMPVIDEQYKKYPIRMNQSVCPMIEASFEIDGQQYSDWFTFDTGNTANGILNKNYLSKHNLYKKFSKIFAFGNRAIAIIPKLNFAGQTFDKGLIVLERGKDETATNSGGGVIGNKILKKFNFILDNQQGFIYLKPNHFFDEKDNQLNEIKAYALGLVVLLMLATYFLFRKFKSSKKKKNGI